MTHSEDTEVRDGEERPAETNGPEEPRRAYRPPKLESGERLENTTLASCLTGPSLCGPAAVEG